MNYERIKRGTFLRRPNRFVAEIEIDGQVEICHVKNTGRCRELLLPGVTVLVQEAVNGQRKTKFDLISVYKGQRLINMDSQVPNGVVEEWIKRGNLFPELAFLKREVKYGDSRFDLYGEYGENRRAFLEVKGVTLEQDGTARFPDAPTQRGVKHVEELCRCMEDGYEAYLVFVIQMKGITSFEPNWATHREFGEALVKAREAGVQLLAYDCQVEEDSIVLDQKIPIVL